VRYRFARAALLLPLSGCVAPGPYVAPAYPGYAGPYAQPGYGYPSPGYGYPGYAYNDGAPTYFDNGADWPLVFYGGGWGYWDGYHRWHGAPPGVSRDLELRHPGGAGWHPDQRGPIGRPIGQPGGFPGGPPRPGGPPPGARPPVAVARPVPAARSAPAEHPARREDFR